MTHQRRILLLGLVVAFAVAGGTAWAVSRDESPLIGPAEPAGVLATGTAPSGLAYELSHVDASDVGADPAESFCTQIRTSAAAARGCEYVGARPLRPSFSLLGSDRFFSIIAPKGVAAMEVRVEGETEAARSRSFDAGAAGKLLFVMVGGPMVTSRDPASSQEYEVRLLDADGETVHELAAGDSGGP